MRVSKLIYIFGLAIHINNTVSVNDYGEKNPVAINVVYH